MRGRCWDDSAIGGMRDLWPVVQRDFAPDGSLRDIYVHDTSLDDWNRLVAIARDRYRCEVIANGRELASDLTVSSFSSERATVLIQMDPFAIAGHCFRINEIEFARDAVLTRKPAGVSNPDGDAGRRRAARPITRPPATSITLQP